MVGAPFPRQDYEATTYLGVEGRAADTSKILELLEHSVFLGTSAPSRCLQEPVAGGGSRRGASWSARPKRGSKTTMAFRNRTEAGRVLGEKLARLGLEPPVVLGMARGGVPVAFEVARVLRAPLDVLVVRKLGYPSQPELGIGAIAEGGIRVVNDRLVSQLHVGDELIDRVASHEGRELERRLSVYRGDRDAVEVRGRTVIVVDDGLATGSTAVAAVRALKARGAGRVVLAVPVAPPGAVEALRAEADDVVCVEVTERFFGISEWYDDFHQVSDEEVVRLLSVAHEATVAAHSAGGPIFTDSGVEGLAGDSTSAQGDGPSATNQSETRSVEIPAGGRFLPGELVVPERHIGTVLFAHGSGSSRLSPRNLEVARSLQRAGLATLLFDLLRDDEASVRANVFDIALLGSRVEEATRWLRGRDGMRSLPLGYFGASTGAAAALLAASRGGSDVAAVVSRGGRPDLAGAALESVVAPTLLIVGGADEVVLELNREALSRMRVESRLEIVPGATHLFEEPGALARVSDLAARWFVSHMSGDRSS
jgi:putative phosphoribosyl transferase